MVLTTEIHQWQLPEEQHNWKEPEKIQDRFLEIWKE
jgi:hypothetical protein